MGQLYHIIMGIASHKKAHFQKMPTNKNSYPVISLVLTWELKHFLSSIAADKNISVSQLVREILIKYLDKDLNK